MPTLSDKRFSTIQTRNIDMDVQTPETVGGQCGGVERISCGSFAILDSSDLFDPAIRAVALRNCDGAVERDNRRRTNRYQCVVERNSETIFPQCVSDLRPRAFDPIAIDPGRKARLIRLPDESTRAGRRAAFRHMSAERTYVVGVAPSGCSRSGAANRISARIADSADGPW